MRVRAADSCSRGATFIVFVHEAYFPGEAITRCAEAGTTNVYAQYLDVNPVPRLVYASDNFLTNVVNVISE